MKHIYLNYKVRSAESVCGRLQKHQLLRHKFLFLTIFRQFFRALYDYELIQCYRWKCWLALLYKLHSEWNTTGDNFNVRLHKSLMTVLQVIVITIYTWLAISF